MENPTGDFNLEPHELIVGEAHRNLASSALYEPAIRFAFDVPTECPGVPRDILEPRGAWADVSAHDARAKELAGLFRENFKKYESGLRAEIKAAGPA